jgi:hypothetical protein
MSNFMTLNMSITILVLKFDLHMAWLVSGSLVSEFSLFVFLLFYLNLYLWKEEFVQMFSASLYFYINLHLLVVTDILAKNRID